MDEQKVLEENETKQVISEDMAVAPMYFSVSPLKLFVMSICTLGLYQLYWYYKNWSLIKKRENTNILPVLRSLFAIFFCFHLFERIQNSADSISLKKSFNSYLLAAGWILFSFLSYLPNPYWLITYCSVIFLLPVQMVANEINITLCPKCDPNKKYSGWNVLGIIIGGLIFVLAVLGTFVPIEEEYFEQKTLWDVHIEKQNKIIKDSTNKLAWNPKDTEAYYSRGEAYRLSEEYNKAVADFNKTIELDPKFARAYEGRADSFFALGMNDEGNADLKKAEEIDPNIFDDDKNRGFGYISKETNEFIFPAVDGTKRHREGNLILGTTTLDKTIKMLPQWPGHGPELITKEQIPMEKGKTGEFFQNIKYAYNPMIAGNLILFFDKKKILVGIHVYLNYAFDSESKESKRVQANIKTLMEQYPFNEVADSNSEIRRLRGEIIPCVTVDILDPIADKEPISVIEYFFTCPII